MWGQGFGPAAGLLPGADGYVSPAPRGSAAAAQKGWPHMDLPRSVSLNVCFSYSGLTPIGQPSYIRVDVEWSYHQRQEHEC